MVDHNTVFARMLKFIPTCLSRQADRDMRLSLWQTRVILVADCAR